MGGGIVAFCTLWLMQSLSAVYGIQISTLYVQNSYVALSGDIKVHFKLIGAPKDSYQIHLREVGQNTTLVTEYTEYGKMQGWITFPCGAIDHAGVFEFKMKHEDEWLSRSNQLKVLWPSFTFTIPTTHKALTSPVDLSVVSTTARCGLPSSGSKYAFELMFDGVKKEFGGWRQDTGPFSEIQGKKFRIPCDYLDQPGVFRIVLRCSSNASDVVATSNAMTVEANDNYMIIPVRKSIKPCQKNHIYNVTFTRPECYHSSDFVRLYSEKRKLKSSILAPVVKKKVRERRVKKKAHDVHFKCKIFRENVQTYCFEFVSITKTKAVVNQHEICVPYDDGPDAVVDGGWGPWSSWSECTVSCGKGTRNRFRLCNNPVPSETGKFCGPESLDSTDCGKPCPTPRPVTPPKILPTLPPLEPCSCGCHLTNLTGSIQSSIGCNGTSIWILNISSPYIVSLTFDFFQLNSLDRNQSLKVRDGKLETDSLIVHWDGGEKPTDVTSSKNYLRIELESKWPVNATTLGYYINATYKSFLPPTVGPDLKAEEVEESDTSWQDTGVIIGVVACIVIVLVTVALVLHHCVWKRRKRKILEKQANGELPLDQDVHTPGSKFTHLLQPGSSLTSDAPSSVGGRKLKHKSQLNKGFKTFKGDGNPSSKNSSASSLMGGKKKAKHSKLKSIPSPYGTKPEDFIHDKNIFTAPPPQEPQTTEAKFESLKKRKHKHHDNDDHKKDDSDHKHEKHRSKRDHHDDKDDRHKQEKHHHHGDHRRDRKHSPDKHKHHRHKSKEKEVEAVVHKGGSSDGLAADTEVRNITGGAESAKRPHELSPDKKTLGKHMGANVAIVSPKTKVVSPPDEVPGEYHENPPDHEGEGKGKALKRGHSGPKNKNFTTPTTMATIAENVALESSGTLRKSKGVTAKQEDCADGQPEQAPPVVQYPYFGAYPYYYAPVSQVDNARSPTVFYPSAAGTPPGSLPAHQVEGATHPTIPVMYPVMYACQGAGEGMAPYPQFMVPVSQSGTVSPTRAFSPVNEGGAQMIPIPAMVVAPHYISSGDEHNAAHSTSSRGSDTRERRHRKSRTHDKTKSSPTKSNTMERRRSSERPDGKSPGNESTNEKTASGSKVGASKARSNQSPSSLKTSDGMEYDTYLPNVPGSFLNNDNAYAMKWPRYGKPGVQKADARPAEVVEKENVL